MTFESFPGRTLVQMKIHANQLLAEIAGLRAALLPFTGAPETSPAETEVPDDSPVTIRCQLGDVRRAHAAILGNGFAPSEQAAEALK